jgi:multimeric flavodoxin WrbA
MMNILVTALFDNFNYRTRPINGSPRGAESNTLKLTNTFIDGIHKAGNHQVKTINVSQKT